jgi:kynureninase
MVTGSPHVLQLVALESGVDLWLDVDMAVVREKSVALTELFIALIEERCAGMGFSLLTPRDPARRGSQVSFRHADGYGVVRALIERGVIGDFRHPDTCRFGFAALYLRHVDVWDAVQAIVEVVGAGAHLDKRWAERAAVT